MPAAVRPPENAENAEERQTIAANRRWALVASAIPGLVVGVILAVIVLLAGVPLAAIGVLVVVTLVAAGWVWRAAPGMVVRAVGARPSNPEVHPRLHNVVDGLCATMGLPQPAVLVVDSPVLNAMAVGRHPSTASLIVTSGLEESLSLVELEGVVAQELVHIKRHDTVRSGVAVAVTAPLALLTSSGAARVHSLVGLGPRILGGPTGRRGGALPDRPRLRPGQNGGVDREFPALASGRRADLGAHPVALDQPSGRVPLGTGVGRRPRRHRSPGRRSRPALTHRRVSGRPTGPGPAPGSIGRVV